MEKPKKALIKQTDRERIRLDGEWKFHLGDVAQFPQIIPIKKWLVKNTGREKPKNAKAAKPDFPVKGWKTIKPGQDVFNKQAGFAWFKTDLPDVSGPGRVILFTSVSDAATIYLNGKFLAYHEIWTDPFEVQLDAAWNKNGRNHLAVLVQNWWGRGFIDEANLELKPAGTNETGRAKHGPMAINFDDKIWRKIHLPHDFVVEGTFDKKIPEPCHGFLPKGIGWYRRTFNIPQDDRGKRIWIDFDGVFRDCRVWLNGKLLGRHWSGYTSFRFDITDAVIYGGMNVLSVRVDAHASEGWWYEGGGIYRHVWLNKAGPLHIAPCGIFVATKPIKKKTGLTVKAEIINHAAKAEEFKLHAEIFNAKGKIVAGISGKGKAPANGKKQIVMKGIINNPKLWSLENPHLYSLKTSVEKNNRIVDCENTTFGVRSIKFDADKGFLLNGKPVKLLGTCNHQDHAGVGIAIPDRLFTYRVEKLKEMGSNAYRCSHNPPAAELLDECDKQGMLVIDENRRLGDSKEILSQVESMVLRDRNHPSIILWSICNEEKEQGTDIGQKRGNAIKKLIKKLDHTRPITAAMNGDWGRGITGVIDVQGFNYNIVQYEPFRKKFPYMPVFGSETASTVSTRGIYRTDRDKGYVSAYDVNHTEWSHTAENAWRPIAERPYMAGAFVWTGFDYRGEPTPYGWPCVNSHFGIMDTCGFPKDNYYYYKAWWSGKPVLHIFPHWTWPGREGQEIDVWCHTNYDQVELFLNGESMGLIETPRNGHLEWKVRFAPGELKAKAYIKGVFSAETKVETTGTPAAIRLVPYKDRMVFDGEDVMPVVVEILDNKNRIVPVASNLVKFHVSGPGIIAGVGNGDPSSHEPDKAQQRRVFNGLCMVFVQAKSKPGTIKLTANSKGLKQASVNIVSIEK